MPARKASSKKKASAKKQAAKAKRRPAAKPASASHKKSVTKASPRKAKSAPSRATASGSKVSRKTSTSKKKPVAQQAARKPVAKKAAVKQPSTRKVSPKRMPAKASASRKKSKPSSPSRTSAAPKPNTPRGSMLTGPIRGFEPYQPKRGEPYMSPAQLEHFRQILLAWKRELMEEVDRTMLHMKDDAANFPDPNDRATQESEFGLELRTRDRERKLLKKIDSALRRIEDGAYGYCEETGDEIGLRRLEARPVATLCVEAQERRELAERQFRDREDHYR
jgi:DnaK suppressor protein